jgi:hypothetical protein
MKDKYVTLRQSFPHRVEEFNADIISLKAKVGQHFFMQV